MSRPMIRKVLRDLKGDGKVELLGRGRSARWRRIDEASPGRSGPPFGNEAEEEG